MRCINPECKNGKDGTAKVHKHSQKGDSWKDLQLCPTCFKIAGYKFKIPMLVFA